MAKLGYITDERAREAIRRPLGVKRGDLYTRIREPFFFDYVKQQLIDELGQHGSQGWAEGLYDHLSQASEGRT